MQTGWNPGDPTTVMTRVSGTNNYSLTLDLYKDTQWKIVINQSWDVGQVSPSSPGVTIQEGGVAIANFATAGGTNMEAVDDNNDGYNFNTKVNGSYTISFTSLPALSRILNITRNSDPIVPPPTNVDYFLVGNFTTPNWGEGFVEANKFAQNGSLYTKTLDLVIGNAFQIVKRTGTVPSWNGAQFKGTVLPIEFADAFGGSGSGNFEVTINGNYSVTIDDSVSPVKANFVRLGAPIVTPPAPEVDPANWKIVGTMTTPGFNPSNNTLPLTPVTGVSGSYFIDLDLVVDSKFKVKTGDTWESGRDLGFGAVTSVTAGLFVSDNGDIKSLVSGKFRVTYAFAPSAGTITIAPLGWIGYTNVVTQGVSSTSIAYVNTKPANFGHNAQLRLTSAFDQTKEGVEFDFTGKANDQYMFKVEFPGGAASEKFVTATGDAQKVIVPVVQLSPTQRATLNLFVVFARTDESTGTLVVRGWKYVDSVTPDAPVWAAVGTSVSVTNNVMTMTYTNTPGEFWNQRAEIAVNAFDGSKTSVTVPFTGVAGQEYMFKFEYPGHNNNVEFRAVATGAAQTVIMNLANLTPEIRATINKFVVFSTTTGASGSVTVSPYYYTPVWAGFGGAVVTVDSGAVTMTYTARTDGFYDQNAQLGVVGYDSSKTSLTVAFTGVANQQYMFKVEFVGGNREFIVTATGAAQTTTLDLSALTPEQRASINKYVIFSFIKTDAGSITVTSWNYTA